MKILNVNFAFNTTSRGLNDELLNIKELQKLGHYVTMVTTDVAPYFTDKIKENGKEFATFQENKPIEIYGIPVYVLHCTIPKMAWYSIGADRLAREIVRNYDVVHIRNWYDHLSLTFYKRAYQYGVPFVFTSYGTMDSYVRRKYKREIKFVIDRIYTGKMIKCAAALHSLGESDRKEFIKLGAKPQKIFRIDWVAIPDKNFEIKKRTDILDRLDVNKTNRPYLLFLGRIDKKKGIDLLVKSFARLNHMNLTLVIAGSENNPYGKKIKQLVHDLALEESIKFSGLVLGDEKLQLLESAKIFVLTSYSDIHPAAVQEALTMGIPILITKNCDFPEVEEYNAGKIVETNIDSIHQGLIKMVDDVDKLQIFSKNAKKLISEKFQFEGKAEKYEEMYKYAIENKHNLKDRKEDS